MAQPVLTIEDYYPTKFQTNVYRDVDITIKFDKPLEPSTVNNENVKLYVMPGYAGMISTSVSIDPTNANLIHVTPIDDLPANTKFQLILYGDHNINDTIVSGISSTYGSVLDGNWLLDFTTGEQREVDIVPSVPPTLPGNGGSSGGSTLDSIQVIQVSPEDNADFVDTDLQTIDVLFDRNVLATNDSIQITAERLDDPFIYSVSIPTVSGTTLTSGGYVSWSLSGDLSTNTFYNIKILHNKIEDNTGTSNGVMLSDYSWGFATTLEPYYTTPYKVRMAGGYLVSGVPDSVINRYILEASLEAERLTNSPRYTYPANAEYDASGNLLNGPLLPEAMVRLTTCLTVQKIAEGITLGALKGIKEKDLADLKIVYDTSKTDVPLDKMEDCIETALKDLGLDLGTNKDGVKSYNAVLRNYPDGRRIIKNRFRL